MVCTNHKGVEVSVDMEIKQGTSCSDSYSVDANSVIVAGEVSLDYSMTEKDYGSAFDTFFTNTISGCTGDNAKCTLYEDMCTIKLSERHPVYIDQKSHSLRVELDSPRGFSEDVCIKCVDSNEKITKKFKVTQNDQCMNSLTLSQAIFT